MSDDDKIKRISEDRPLDALLPELEKPPTRGDASAPSGAAVHPRVLEVQLEHHMEWALACWADPGPQALREQLRRLLEVTFLAEYSQPATEELVERNFEAVQLLVFADLDDAAQAVLEELGFSSVSYVPDNYVERMSAWRDEARAAGGEVPNVPRSVWKADIERPSDALAEKLAKLERQMVNKLDGDVWGETPGGPSRLMATYMRQFFNTTVTPSREGLHNFELFLVQETPGKLRWLGPVVFQGLCDFMGVLLQAEHNFTVQWALCTPDSSGFAPPPVFRVLLPGGHRHVSIGQLVVQWAVMPRDEDDPSLATRLDEVADGLKL